MSDYEDDSMMQNGSDNQPTKIRDPLDDEEEEEDGQPPRRSRYEDDEDEEEEEEEEGGPGDSRAKKKAKVRAFCCLLNPIASSLFGFRNAIEGLPLAVSSTLRPKLVMTRRKRTMTTRMVMVRLLYVLTS